MIKFLKKPSICKNDTRYIVELDKEYTVREFIEAVLSQRKNEYGVFINTNISEFNFIPYDNGKLITDISSKKKYSYLDKKIKQVTANRINQFKTDYTYRLEE